MLPGVLDPVAVPDCNSTIGVRDEFVAALSLTNATDWSLKCRARPAYSYLLPAQYECEGACNTDVGLLTT